MQRNDTLSIHNYFTYLHVIDYYACNCYTHAGFSSWSIRHGAILGLSRVCRVCSNLPMKDGLSEVAWRKLMERHTAENDSRVIEAYKVSKVHYTCVRLAIE